MYKELIGSNGSNEENPDEDNNLDDDVLKNEDAEATCMPTDWTFSGFISFALWGPIMPDDANEVYRAQSFWAADGPPSLSTTNGSAIKRKKVMGRVALRKQEQNEDNSSRSHASVHDKRGLTTNQVLIMASMNQQQNFASMAFESKILDKESKTLDLQSKHIGKKGCS